MTLNRQLFIEKVLKFGGSSLETPSLIENVLNIILTAYVPGSRIAVVVSAFGGITDQLIFLGSEAKRLKRCPPVFYEIKEKHIETAQKLIERPLLNRAMGHLQILIQQLKVATLKIARTGDFSKKSLDEVMSFGEKMSALIISEVLKKYMPSIGLLNTENIIRTNRSFGQGLVDFESTNRNIIHYFQKAAAVTVTTGFIASSTEGETSTLGRGGSDYTASILGAALDARVIELWKDVDGIMTSDPKKSRHALLIPKLSYSQALAMSLRGAGVIHYCSLLPAQKKGIPILIKNSFRQDAPGTLIQNHDVSDYILEERLLPTSPIVLDLELPLQSK